MRTFRELATRGSLAQAAQTLGMSRANVSKYLAELESRLGCACSSAPPAP
ncbi:MAG: helix-turn-helix domain-containing protein [Burkholderiaceae bacterium]